MLVGATFGARIDRRTDHVEAIGRILRRSRVLITPEQRAGGQIDGHDGAGRGGANEHAVGKAGSGAGVAAKTVGDHALFDHGQLLRPLERSGRGGQDQKANLLAFHFGQGVQVAEQRQRRAQKKSAGQLGLVFAGDAANFPPQFALRAQFARRQAVGASRIDAVVAMTIGQDGHAAVEIDAGQP